MICMFFFFSGGTIPVKIKKVKEWKRENDKEFYIVGRTDEGDIGRVIRLSDDKIFSIDQTYDCKNGGKIIIKKFHFDCIHVDIRYYRYELDELVRTKETIHINEL